MILSFRGTDPDECPLVVQAVVDSYKAFLSEIYRGMSDDTLRLIGEARDLLNNDLQQQEEAYAEFRQQSPLVTRGTDEVNPLQDRLTAIETQRSQLVIRRAEMERQTDGPRKREEQGARAATIAGADFGSASSSHIGGRPPKHVRGVGNPIVSASRQTTEAVGALRSQPSSRTHSPRPNRGHSKVLDFANRGPFADAGRCESCEPASEPASDDADAVQAYSRYLEEEVEQIRISEEQLTKLYEREHQAAKELSSYQLKDERFRRNIDLNQQLYDGVISQLQDANLVKDYGGFEAHVIAPPRLGEKVHPSGRIILAASLLVGAVFGFFGTMAAELTDKSFRSRDEIRSQLGSPVLGQIPQFSAAKVSERPNGRRPGRVGPHVMYLFRTTVAANRGISGSAHGFVLQQSGRVLPSSSGDRCQPQRRHQHSGGQSGGGHCSVGQTCFVDGCRFEETTTARHLRNCRAKGPECGCRVR